MLIRAAEGGWERKGAMFSPGITTRGKVGTYAWCTMCAQGSEASDSARSARGSLQRAQVGAAQAAAARFCLAAALLSPNAV